MKSNGNIAGVFFAGWFIAAILSSCTHDAPPISPITQSVPKPSCLPMKTYSVAQSKELALEWTQLKAEHPLWLTSRSFIPGAVTLRNENRAVCR